LYWDETQTLCVELKQTGREAAFSTSNPAAAAAAAATRAMKREN
jgi:hypothetical protein